MPKDNLLIVGDSERTADLLYAMRTFVPDPVIWFQSRGRCIAVVNDAEFDRVRAEARHCRILSYSKVERRLFRENNGEPVTLGAVLGSILKEHRIKKVTVAESFPLGLARDLRRLKIKVKLRAGPFFPERARKTSDEVKKISAAVLMAEIGLAEALQTLRRARPGKGRCLMLNQAPLTAERLRAVIDTAVLQAGGQAQHTIVACGRQSSDPHERGFGPLLANEPIVIDVFPRSQRTGYCGDISRTVVRGRASETLRAMYAAVREAQEAAQARALHGVAAADVHRAAEDALKRNHFKTSRRNGRLEGFLHGVGHGVGLEVHEPPRLSAGSRDSLRAGHVITVEPALYYANVGGVRLEDVILVTRGAPKNLTKAEKQLEI